MTNRATPPMGMAGFFCLRTSLHVAAIGLPAMRSGKPEPDPHPLMMANPSAAARRVSQHLRGGVGISFRNRQDSLPVYTG